MKRITYFYTSLFFLYHCILLSCEFPGTIFAQDRPGPEAILDRIDENMVSSTVDYSAQMIIHQRDRVDVKTMRVWSEGKNSAFVEFLSPARDKGTKYLRLQESLWMFLPNIEKTIKISGHLLRQSMMGSDFSYEDTLDRIKLREDYTALLLEDEFYNERPCYVLDMVAARKDVTYYRRKIWVDKELFISLKSELYAKTGKLLKIMTADSIEKFQGRFYPVHMEMHDQLRKYSSTEFIITEITFDAPIPSNIFSLRNLERR